MILPPKPQFHPADNVRAIQSRVDAFYNDLERLFKGARRIYRDVETSIWYPASAPGTQFQAWVVGEEPYELSDEELLEQLQKKDPLLAERLKKRLEK